MTLRLDQPDRHNRLSVADLALFAELLDRAEAEPTARVIMLRAAPGPIFCAGFEIDALQATDWQDNQFARTVARLERTRLPVICEIGGAIYGGACELALVCDLRIGTAGIVLQLPPAKLGLVYFPDGLERFVRRLGPGATKRLVLTAEKVTGAELSRLGFLDYLVPEETLAAETQALAERIAALAPGAVQEMKRTIDGVVRGDLNTDKALERAVRSFGSNEAREGIAAFQEKRDPNFTDG